MYLSCVPPTPGHRREPVILDQWDSRISRLSRSPTSIANLVPRWPIYAGNVYVLLGDVKNATSYVLTRGAMAGNRIADFEGAPEVH